MVMLPIAIIGAVGQPPTRFLLRRDVRIAVAIASGIPFMIGIAFHVWEALVVYTGMSFALMATRPNRDGWRIALILVVNIIAWILWFSETPGKT